MNKTLIGEMSWVEFKEYAENNKAIIIPVGVTEEHGIHNPLGTDSYIAEHSAKLVGERSNVAVAPVLPFGYSPNVVDFAGSISIDPILFRKILFSYAESYVKHGITRILFINGHGGNDDVLNMVCRDLFDKYKVLAAHNEWWLLLPEIKPEWSCADHGGKFETSMMLATDDSIIDMSKAEDCPAVCELTSNITYAKGWRFKDARINIPLSLYEAQKVGNAGLSPKEASKKLGEEMIEEYVNYNVDLIRELIKIEI